MKLITIRLDQFVKNMINSNNKNYSFIAISKRSKSKKNQINSTLYRIYSPSKSFHRKSQQSNLNLSYVSPNTQQINSFKSKLTNYLHQNPFESKIMAKTNGKDSLHSMTETFKNDEKSFYKSTNKWYSEGIDKKKNIRQYISQHSHDKRKLSENKTVQLESHTIKQYWRQKSNPMLIIRKFKRPKDQRKQLQPTSIFKQREVPIHHTQVYYFSKTKVRTEPLENSISLANTEMSEKKHVTISRIFKLREEFNMRQIQKSNQRLNNNELLMINQIHPTVAIITTRKSENKNLTTSGEREIRVSTKIDEDKQNKTKQEDEISPWKRKNQNQFQFY